MANCSVTPKIFVGVLTIIYWLAAAALIFVGSWVYVEYQHYEEIAKALYTLIPATILIAVGVFFFILGLVGCIGACKEQRCLLGVYFTLLLVILCGMITSSALGWVYRHDVKSAVEKGIHKGLYNYNDTIWKDEIDFMQTELECCGLNNYTDWQDTPYGKDHHPYYPPSCNNCTGTACNSTSVEPYEEGCYTKLEDQFLNHLAWIVGVAAVFALLQIIGMVCACFLMCRRDGEAPYIGLTSPEHMRV